MRAPLTTLPALVRDRRGVAATEAALVLPFVLALGGGVLEFGMMYHRMQLMEAGVRDAARYLARTGNPSAMEAAAKQLAVTGTVAPGGTPRVRSWETGHVTVTYRATANPRPATGSRPYRGGDIVEVVRVEASLPYEGLGFLALVRLNGLRIGAVHEERVVGG
jgi:Flp pilus assembly protein TadG